MSAPLKPVTDVELADVTGGNIISHFDDVADGIDDLIHMVNGWLPDTGKHVSPEELGQRVRGSNRTIGGQTLHQDYATDALLPYAPSSGYGVPGRHSLPE